MLHLLFQFANKLSTGVVFITLLGLFVACNPQPEAKNLLDQAEMLMDSQPDSAMLLIDSIFYPEKSLKQQRYMDYLVARVQARYKNYRDISEDTLIFTARDYLIKHNTLPSKVALASFYSGCVYREQKEFEPAAEQYKQAESYALQAKDSLIAGLIYDNTGGLLMEQGLYEQALPYYKLAETFYNSFPEKRIISLSSVGSMFLLLNQPDSAIAHYHKALDIATKLKEPEHQSLSAQNLSVAYQRTGRYTEAEIYLRRAFENDKRSDSSPRYYLNFAKLYSNMNRRDSADFYTERLKQTLQSDADNHLRASAYNFLAQVEKGKDNFDAAFDYLELYNTALVAAMEEYNVQAVYDIEQKYNFEQEKNRYNAKLIVRQGWIINLILGVLIVSLIAIWLNRRTIQLNKKLQNMQATIEALQHVAQDLSQSQKTSKTNEDKLRETLLWKFDVQYKAAQIGKLTSVEKIKPQTLLKSFEKIVYGESAESQWATLAKTITEIYPGIDTQIKNKIPLLTDRELKIGLLSYAGLRVKEQALILGQSEHTINQARSAIRKKMKMDEKDGNLTTALRQIFNPNSKQPKIDIH